MIPRPLDLEARMSPPPRDLNAVAWVNVGLIVLFFSLLGSRFVLAPGLLVELPAVDPASVALVPTSVVVGYRRDNVILFEGGMYTLAEMRGHLQDYARKYPGSVLQMNADKQVSTQALGGPRGDGGVRGFFQDAAGGQPAGAGRPAELGGRVRIGKIEVKRRVWIALGCALGVTGVWWGWTRATPPAAVAALPAQPPFVRLVGVGPGASDQVLRERADLFDPTPLFFPTEWNYGQRPLPVSVRRQPGEIFGRFPPTFTFVEQNMKPYGAEITPAPEKLSDVLTQGNEAPFAGFGQIDSPRPALAERVGFLEVRKFSSMKPL